MLVAACVGCAPDDDLEIGSPVYVGESFEVWASDGQTACGGTFDYMERWLDAFHQRVGPVLTTQHHRYYWLSQTDWDHHQPCRNHACAGRAHIFALGIPIEHEVVHIGTGSASSLLTEGLAEVYGTTSNSLPNRELDVALFEEEQLPGDHYADAGHFVRFMLDRHGQQTVLDWLWATKRGDSYEQVAGALAEVAGVSLDAELAEYRDAERCTGYGWRYDFAYCAEPELPEGPDGWSWTLDFDCAAEDVVGPYNDLMWSRRTFVVSTPGIYEVALDSPDRDAFGFLQRCGNLRCEGRAGVNDLRRTAVGILNGEPSVLELEEAVYWIRVGGDAETSGTVELRIRPVDE